MGGPKGGDGVEIKDSSGGQTGGGRRHGLPVSQGGGQKEADRKWEGGAMGWDGERNHLTHCRLPVGESEDEAWCGCVGKEEWL